MRSLKGQTFPLTAKNKDRLALRCFSPARTDNAERIKKKKKKKFTGKEVKKKKTQSGSEAKDQSLEISARKKRGG